jgi:Rrf2 family transcriptional regulator, cysteine metabolism repressor
MPYNLYWESGDSPLNPVTFSVKSDYALLAIFDLALQPQGRPVRIADIAQRQQIPQKFLELILAGLKQSGFVESRRGAEGGYLLGRPAEKITVGEVLQSVSGRREDRGRPRKNVDSPLAGLWSRVDAAVAGVVQQTTFADLVREWTDRQSQMTYSWDI